GLVERFREFAKFVLTLRLRHRTEVSACHSPREFPQLFNTLRSAGRSEIDREDRQKHQRERKKQNGWRNMRANGKYESRRNNQENGGRSPKDGQAHDSPIERSRIGVSWDVPRRLSRTGSLRRGPSSDGPDFQDRSRSSPAVGGYKRPRYEA